ncbi:hypothetical protein BGW38_007406 [Lunasporangiospora selenospora]|uniref:Enoyl reductase (ER) domain-containing protein n=1 Tax=Lunasporangiospora selenospora TaxID=979761 RepID=A0A9P6FKN4_9FUNG|nr:hypothetical protein BGW38_007406 [Lunasporangiospora selenospora]
MTSTPDTSSDASLDKSTTFTGWASTGTIELKKWSYHPRLLSEDEIEIEITHCGICGSDIHTITSGWGDLKYSPCIPGHEVVGKVVVKGANTTHQIGDLVGVGGLISSCGNCKHCKTGFEQFCPERTFIFNDTFKDGRGGLTYGGFADRLQVHGKFAFKIPDGLSGAEAAPLLCAGLTVFNPLKTLGAGPGKKVGVIGIGGLGHLGVQFARAMQCDEVVAISSGDSKREEAFKLGATKYINSSKPEEMKAAHQSLDIILYTSTGKNIDWSGLVDLIGNRGKLVVVAFLGESLGVPGYPLNVRHISISGSIIGGIETTKEMIAFAAKHNVRSLVEVMPMSNATEAIQRADDGHPRFRVVLDASK